MVDEDKYCIDILTQVSAATRALENVALGLLDDHLGHCVTEAAAESGDVANEKIAEASAAIAPGQVLTGRPSPPATTRHDPQPYGASACARQADSPCPPLVGQ